MRRRAVGLIVAILLLAHVIVASSLVVCTESGGRAELEWIGATCCADDDGAASPSTDGLAVDRHGCDCYDEVLGAAPAQASSSRDLSADIAHFALSSTAPALRSMDLAVPASFDVRPVIDDTRSELARRLSVVLRC